MNNKGRRDNNDFICKTESTLTLIGNAVCILNIIANAGSKLSQRHHGLYVLWHELFPVKGQAPVVPDNYMNSKCHHLLSITIAHGRPLQGERFLKIKLGGITIVSKIQRETQLLGKRL